MITTNDVHIFLLKVLRKCKNTAYAIKDYYDYSRRAEPYRRLLRTFPVSESAPALLIISGRGMNISWAQIWSVMSLPVRAQGYRGLVLTTRQQRLLNRYFLFLGLELIFLDDYSVSLGAPHFLQNIINSAQSHDAYAALTYKNSPVGQIALSTYSRHKGTGLINYHDSEVRDYINMWIGRICGYIDIAEKLYDQYGVSMLYFTEVFMEEYGAFYYAALNKKLNIIRFAGTIRDDAFIMQHLSHANDRIHHSSIDPTTWEKLKERNDDRRIEAELMQNFSDRYSNKWHRSKRNHPDTKQMDVASARIQLGVAEGRKVAVIYSHILYDTLFFFGTDLFEDYSKWLVETVRAAIANPHVDWLIKVHPSNLWRGELDSMLKGRYEEERLLYNHLGTLPPHVRIIGADTKINPFTWFQLADYGITVRGTSGLEMAALGKTVVTAGTGRYEGNGFTLDSNTSDEYLSALRNIHALPSITAEQQRLAKCYAHAIFVLKPYTLSSFDVLLRAGCRQVQASDDLIYLPKPLFANHLGEDLLRFGQWAGHPMQRDLLTYSNENADECY